ncbi:unnamed protein product [Trypanosoma congolense IL3000]|uniref:WGS project CAEQ00000000 data, annotated contig 2048 n=1 Tax=Trypanosoma congolense (strain IL3000) TaxID=1068625 RepID=F9WB15_TRYCI|nr:unnamed protein product [Trypanosoma congolense IL3000]
MLSNFDLISSWKALKALKTSEAFFRCTICWAGFSVHVAFLTLYLLPRISPGPKLLLLNWPSKTLRTVKIPQPHQRDFSRSVFPRIPRLAPLIKLQPAFVVLVPLMKCGLRALCLMPSIEENKFGSCSLTFLPISTKLYSPKSFLLSSLSSLPA